MKKITFVSSIALLASPALAAEPSTVFDSAVSAEIGYQSNTNNYDYGYEDSEQDTSTKGPTFALAGTVALPLSDLIALQADAIYSRDLMNLPTPFTVANKSTTVATHLFARKTDTFVLGAIGQVSFNTISATGSTFETNQYFIGAEGQTYLGKTTVTGQVVYRKDAVGGLDYGSESINADGYLATFQAKYFLNDNWTVALKGQYSKIKFNINESKLDQWHLGLTSERRLAALPVSLFFGARLGETKVSDIKLRDVRGLFGLKVRFGSQSLKSRDRSGASLDAIKTDILLPYF